MTVYILLFINLIFDLFHNINYLLLVFEDETFIKYMKSQLNNINIDLRNIFLIINYFLIIKIK